MSPIVSFYLGQAPDDRGRTIEQIWAYGPGQLESIHDYIQRLFPARRPSQFADAPLLDDETERAFRDNPELRERLLRSLDLMLGFYGLRRQGAEVVEAADFCARAANWLTPSNHGVGHIAFGPDGHLYVNSGSRTDGNEPGKDARYSKDGETPLTACIWRLDPGAEKPKIEIYARGLRNAYGFCWNERGEMIATDNGPDADPAEELNLVEWGKHYGFPY